MKGKEFLALLLVLIIAFQALSIRVDGTAEAEVGEDSSYVVTNESELTANIKDSLLLNFEFSSPIVTKVGGYDSASMVGFPKFGAPGEPILPFKLVRVLIPKGTAVKSIDVATGDRILLDGAFNLEFGKNLLPTSSNVTIEDRPDPEIYGSDSLFPRGLYSDVVESNLRGHSILILELHPVQYAPITGKLSYFNAMTLTVELSETDKISSLLRDKPKDRELVLKIVDNPDDIGTYAKLDVTGYSQITSEPTTLVDPSLSYNYVIITNSAMSASFLPLMNWKNQKGITATIVLVEDILLDPAYNSDGFFGDGQGSPKFNDTQSHIRNFIKDAYQHWETEYVLLGGDDEIIPARGVYVEAGTYTDYNIPCDMYYGALDGSWDLDNDTIFGEALNLYDGPENGTAGEEADFYGEVYIGRATVDTNQEATNFVGKTLSYEQNSQADYLKNALMIGLTLDSLTEGGNGKDLVAEIVPQYTTT